MVGLAMKLAITNVPSGKLSIGPRSTRIFLRFVKEGRTMKPSTGNVTATPIAAPRPIVVASRNRERVYMGRGTCPSPVVGAASSATTRVSGSTSGTSPRTSRVTSRAHRSPNTIASAAPTAAMIQLITSPTRRQATAMAKPIGHRLGLGAWLSLRCSLNSCPAWIQSLRCDVCQRRNDCRDVDSDRFLRAASGEPRPSRSPVARRVAGGARQGRRERPYRKIWARLRTRTGAARRRIAAWLRVSDEVRSKPVLRPAPAHELADLLAHDDLLGPRAGVLLAELVGRVDP